MPPKDNADLAHPQAADWVLGTLGPNEAIGFQLHLRGCPHCQAAVAEFGQLGQMLRHLPPAAELPPGLEARTLASVLAAAAEDRTPTQVHQVPEGLRPAAEDQAATEVHPVPQAAPAAAGADQRAGGMARVIRFPRWRGRAGLLAAASAAAAAIIAAILVLAGVGGGPPQESFAFRLVPPSGSGQAASATATARLDASGSWDITLTVKHLKSYGDAKWYECWYSSPGNRKVASAGTFLVPDSGNGTFSMTSAVDPTEFPIMEIRIEQPNENGARQGRLVLSGRGQKL
jgi:hypothetical protein